MQQLNVMIKSYSVVSLLIGLSVWFIIKSPVMLMLFYGGWIILLGLNEWIENGRKEVMFLYLLFSIFIFHLAFANV